MTNWQKSCVEAIIAGPTAFSLFKLKQKNKRMIDQYIERIWPYKIKKGEPEIEIKLIKTAIGCLELALKNECSVQKNIVTNKNGALLLGRILVKKENEEDATRHIAQITAISNEDATTINVSEENGIIHALAHSLRLTCGNIDTISATVNDRYKKQVKREIKKTKSIIKEEEQKKKKKEYKGINIGIEIEYDGCNMQFLEKEMLRNNAISFNSGWDGGSQDGESMRCSERLRENRLRINGHKGLNALWILTEEMKKKRCRVTKESGMHYHIDCTERNKWSKMQKIRIMEANKDLNSYLGIIFEIPKDKEAKEIILRHLRSSDFYTLEWRMGTATLTPSILTIQILTAIHITEWLTMGTLPRLDYVKCLAEIFEKITNQKK